MIISRRKRKKPDPETLAAPVEPPADIKLLMEIRDLLKQK